MNITEYHCNNQAIANQTCLLSLALAKPTLRERGEGVDGETVANDLLGKLDWAMELHQNI
jgi:hypothetical protein